MSKRAAMAAFSPAALIPTAGTSNPSTMGIPCPEDDCGGKVVEKQSRKGKVFYGCDQYPSCKFASWEKPVAQACGTLRRRTALRKEQSGRRILSTLQGLRNAAKKARAHRRQHPRLSIAYSLTMSALHRDSGVEDGIRHFLEYLRVERNYGVYVGILSLRPAAVRPFSISAYSRRIATRKVGRALYRS